MKLKNIVLVVCLVLSGVILGQGEANIWYMGQEIGLDFSTTPPTLISGLPQAGMDGPNAELESFSSISDAAGNFLFGVAGKNIFSADLTYRGSLPDGSNYHLAQGSQIVPVPGTTNQYYIISVPMGNTGSCTSPQPSYTLVTVSGTTGNNITIGASQHFDYPDVTGGQMTLPVTDAMGNPTGEQWIIFHGVNNNDFHIYKMSNSGVMTFEKKVSQGPSASIVNCGLSGGDVAVMLKSNGCYNQFAMNYGSNVSLFDFDSQNADIVFKNSAGPLNEPYGIEFSPSGKNVYVSTGTWLSGTSIYKIPVSPGGTGSSMVGATLIGDPDGSIRGGSMQLAPDGKIYVGGFSQWGDAWGTTAYIGAISDPDGAGTFDPKAIAIPDPGFLGMGLPSFPSSLVAGIAKIRYQAGCAGDQVDFTFTLTGSEQTPPERLWQFFSGPTATGAPAATATTAAASHTWAAVGTYAVTFQLKDICGRIKYDTVQVVIDELLVTINAVDSVCPGETATFSSSDATASNYKWFNAEVGGAQLGTGASLTTEVLVADSICVWVEPDGIVAGPFTGGATASEWGVSTSTSAGFSANKALMIDGFSVTGAGAWGCTDYNVTVSVKQGAATIASTTAVVTCGTTETVLTGLGLAVPQGSGYTLEITGGSVQPTTGTVSSVSGLITIADSDPFFNWKVYEMNPCFSRKRACSYEGEDCTCRDTSLIAAPVLCVDTTYNLNTLFTDTTYKTGQWVKVSGGGTITNDSLLVVNTTDDGSTVVRYEVYFGADAGKVDCADSNVRIIVINPLDEVDIINGQGPFCIADGNQTLSLSGGTIAGGTWSVLSTVNATIDASSGLITPSDSGFVNVVYTSPTGGCLNADTLQIEFKPDEDIDIITLDTIVCLNSAAFSIRLSASSATDGTWSGAGVSGSTFDPTGLSAGSYQVKYVKNGFSVSCSDSDSVMVTITALDSAKVNVDNIATCANVGNVDLTALITGGTSAGTWSGTSVTGTNFSTAIAGATYNIVYTTSGSCPTKDSLEIIVTDKITAAVSLSKTTFCANEAIETASGTPGGGVYWGYGITNATGSFDPSTATWNPLDVIPGTDTVFYGIASACGDTAFALIAVDSLDLAQSQDAIPSACSVDPAFQLTLDGGTTGGLWADSLGANTYVTAGGMFNPNGLTDGLYKVYYLTTGNCPAVDSSFVNITSNISYAYQNSNDTTLCLNYGLDTLDVGVSGGIIWTKSGKGVVDAQKLIFDTRLMDVGVDSLWYGKAGACGDTVAYEFTISPIDTAVIDQIGPFCADDLAGQGLTIVGSATGGSWTGNGVTGSTFTASSAGAGTHEIIYITTGLCPIQDTMYIVVNPRKVATITANTTAFCGAATADTLFSAQSGGTWSGWAGSWSLVAGQDSVILFDPNVQSGINMIYYEIVDVCGAIDSMELSVTAMEIAEIDSVVAVCADALAFAYTVVGTQGGTWTDGSGTNTYIDAAGLFTPSDTVAGTWTIKYQTPGGCFVRDSLTIVVKPRMDATITPGSLTFCPGDAAEIATPVDAGGIWTGWTATTTEAGKVLTFNPTVAGIDSLVYTIADVPNVSCGDTDTLRVIVTVSDSAEIVAPTTVCEVDGPITLAITSPGSTPGGIWGGDGITSPSLGTFTPSGANKGTTPNNVTYRTQGVCPDTGTVQIYVVDQVTINIDKTTAVNDTIKACAGDPDVNFSLLTGSTPGGSWSVDNGGSIDVNGVFTTGSAVGGTTYTVTHWAGDTTTSCSDVDNVLLYVQAILDPTITGAPSTTQCIDDGTFTGFGTSGDLGGVWTISAAGSINASTGVVDMSASGAGTFTVTYTHPVTCSVFDTQTITIELPLDATINSVVPFCENLGGQQLTPLVLGGVWGGTGVGATGLFSPSVGEGTYPVTYTLTNACVAIGNLVVQIDKEPTVEITPSTTGGCEPLDVVFTNSSASAVLSTVWTFDDGSSVTTTTVDTVAQTYNTGTYGVKVSQTFANGCIAESTYLNMVTVDALPVAGFTYLPAQPTVLDPRVQFADSSEIAVSFKWDFGRTATPSGSSSPIPFVEFDTENGDTIKVCMVAYSQALQTGCTDTVCKDVIILNNLSVYVPNSFTPNGDGLNDVFYPLGKYHDNQEGLSEYEFLIFNRWGEVVFKSTVPYKGWNGAYMNHDVQEEVYVWMIKVYDPLSGKTKTSNGTVTVVR